MLLSEIFDQLATGELAQHKYGKSGVIEPADYPALIRHVNMALTELHKRFPLKTKELKIAQFSNISLYHLNIKHAVSNTGSTETKYIIDSADNPFLDDLIKIDSVYDDYGEQIPLNDEALDKSVFMAGYDTIQIPFSVDGLNIYVIYRAKHADISTISLPNETEVDIPSTLLEPLLSYIAARCYSTLNSQLGNTTSSFYFSKFNLYCEKITEDNVLNEARSMTNNKLHYKGFP